MSKSSRFLRRSAPAGAFCEWARAELKDAMQATARI